MHTPYNTQGASRPDVTRREALGIAARGAALGVTAAAVVVALNPAPTIAIAAQPDRLLVLIEAYISARDAWRDTTFATDEAADDAFVGRVEPAFDALMSDPPPATTEAGVHAALRLAHEDLGLNAEGIGRPLVAAALGYFGTRPVLSR